MGAATSKKESSRRHFDRWARRYERDPTSRWLATLQNAAMKARELELGGRAVIGDGCSDRLATRFLDLLLRTFQPSHVHFYRSAELEGMLGEAGLSSESSRLLWGGGYVIMSARKRRVESPAAALS